MPGMRRLPCAARAKPGPMRRFAAQGAAGDTATQSVTADAMQKNREPSPGDPVCRSVCLARCRVSGGRAQVCRCGEWTEGWRTSDDSGRPTGHHARTQHHVEEGFRGPVRMCFGGGHAGHLCRSRTDGHQCPAAHTSISILIVSRPRAET